MSDRSSETGEQGLFRDAFNRETVLCIGSRIASTYPEFDRREFESRCLDGFFELSFGDRARRITSTLEEFLPREFSRAASILVASLGPEPTKDHLDGFDGFYVMPLTLYVAKNGIQKPEQALQALYEMTKRFSAEGDIRPFLERYEEQTLAFLRDLTQDPSPFARRLASEGTRPRLPLAGRLSRYQADPGPVIELLDLLYDDPNLMVRRSVANNLNDISKDNPDVVVNTLARWQRERPSDELGWLTRHALRTLVKKDHRGALELLGYTTKGIWVGDFSLDQGRVSLGQALTISWTIEETAGERQRLAMNYIIHFVKASGARKPKVFRLPEKRLEPGEHLELRKTHKFLAYKNQNFYEGQHEIELVINGTSYARAPFVLNVPGL